MADMEQNSTKQGEIDYLRSLIEGLKRELAAKFLAYEGLSGIKDGAFRALEQWQKRAEQLEVALRDAQAWAQRIARDEGVCTWVHTEDYGLYCLLADCPVDFDAALAGRKDTSSTPIAAPQVPAQAPGRHGIGESHPEPADAAPVVLAPGACPPERVPNPGKR